MLPFTVDGVEGHLAVATHKENSAAAKKDGLLAVKRREYRKITEEELIDIRARAAAGETPYSIAKRYDRAQQHITKIVSGQIHSVDKPIKPKITRRGPVPVSVPDAMKEAA